MRFFGYALAGTLAGIGAALLVAAHQHAEARTEANHHKQAVCWRYGGKPVLDRFGTYKVCATREAWTLRLVP